MRLFALQLKPIEKNGPVGAATSRDGGSMLSELQSRIKNAGGGLKRGALRDGMLQTPPTVCVLVGGAAGSERGGRGNAGVDFDAVLFGTAGPRQMTIAERKKDSTVSSLLVDRMIARRTIIEERGAPNQVGCVHAASVAGHAEGRLARSCSSRWLATTGV